jgi:NADH:ubiquinone oxidoreductase subunit 2 (subunit N)
MATMTLGNLAALRQRRLKRLLAYSSIAQAGYVLMGVAVAIRSTGGVPAASFYLLAYLAGYFGPSCPPIPVHRAQPFRSIAHPFRSIVPSLMA